VLHGEETQEASLMAKTIQSADNGDYTSGEKHSRAACTDPVWTLERSSTYWDTQILKPR
jgi:hypothetical protein